MTDSNAAAFPQVIAAYGRHFSVRLSDGSIIDARPIGRKQDIVCGDFVECEYDAAHAAHSIVRALPRRTLLARANARGGSESVVANLSQLVIVVAAQPEPDLFVLDRYLCAATSAGLAALIIDNKADLGEPALAPTERAAFVAAGYSVLTCSARAGVGLEALAAALKGHTSALVGQSGVGKSSLVGALLPDTDIATQSLSREDEGRHTTTSAKIYPLTSGGNLVDSPGVRDFAPAIDRLDAMALGFPEIERLASQCRFRDCKHLQEPACAVVAAVTAGTLEPRRYESYRRLRRIHTDLTAMQRPGR